MKNKNFEEYLATHDQSLIRHRCTALLYNAMNKERNRICAKGKYHFTTWELLDYIQDPTKQLSLNL